MHLHGVKISYKNPFAYVNTSSQAGSASRDESSQSNPASSQTVNPRNVISLLENAFKSFSEITPVTEIEREFATQIARMIQSSQIISLESLDIDLSSNRITEIDTFCEEEFDFIDDDYTDESTSSQGPEPASFEEMK